MLCNGQHTAWTLEKYGLFKREKSERMEESLENHSRKLQTLEQHRQALQAEWDNMNNRSSEDIIDSMPQKCQAIIAAQGGNTRYWQNHRTNSRRKTIFQRLNLLSKFY